MNTDDGRPNPDDPVDARDVPSTGASAADEDRPHVRYSLGRVRPNAYDGVRLPPYLQRSIYRAYEQIRRSRPMLEAYATMQRNLDQTTRQVARAITPQLETMLEQVRKSVLPTLQSPQWQQALLNLGEIRERMLRYWPENWHGVRADDLPDVLRIARDEGLPLVWVPRSEVVMELLRAVDGEARRAVLSERVDDIVADCAVVADREYEPELVAYAHRLREAVAAHRAGLHAPGQALAAVVVTALLQWVYGHGELRKVKDSPLRAPEDPDEQVLRDLKVGILIEAAVPAVRGGIDRLSDHDLPETFNRHATLHRVAERAYTVPRAMCALTLATGLLAEAQQLLEDGRLTP